MCFSNQDAASLAVAILKKQFRGRIFLGCDNHPLSRLHYMLSLEYATNIMETLIASSYLRFVPDLCNCPVLGSDANICSFLSLTLSKCCVVRQEVMDLVYKSGKFPKKFEKFTGK